MKNIVYVFVVLLLIGCEIQAPCECEKETNGFGPFVGQSIYMGSQETVEVFKAIDSAWVARDYEAMKSLINDGGNFTFENGTVVTTAQEFVDFVEQEYQDEIDIINQKLRNLDKCCTCQEDGLDYEQDYLTP